MSCYVGGLIGQVTVHAGHNGGYTSITKLIGQNLVNEGDVSGYDYEGGLIGYGYANDSSSYLVDCSSSGEVTGRGGENVADMIGKAANIAIK